MLKYFYAFLIIFVISSVVTKGKSMNVWKLILIKKYVYIFT